MFDKRNEVLLLYLNDDLFQDEDGSVSNQVELSIKGRRSIILIWENNANMGHCVFRDHILQTPEVLCNLGLYNKIVFPLYAKPEYHVVSLYPHEKTE